MRMIELKKMIEPRIAIRRDKKSQEYTIPNRVKRFRPSSRSDP